MATSMLRCSCGCASRLPQFAVSIPKRRFALDAPKEEQPVQELVKPVSYPGIRGKYPPGSAEKGNGWEGLSSREAWKWEKQRRLIESYTANHGKKLSFLAKKPIKTWKFPAVQWGSGSLTYMADKTKTNIMQDDEYFENEVAYQKRKNVEHATKVLAPILLDVIRLEHKVKRSKLEQMYLSKRGHCATNHYNTPQFENVLSHLKVKNMLHTILNAAQSGILGDCSHLEECALDEKVPVAAQWARYGVERHAPFKKPPQSNTPDELPNNALFYGKHNVDFQIRTYFPIREFYRREDILCRQCNYPRSPYKPTALGQKAESMQRPVTAGYRLGSPYEFIHTSIVHTDEGHLAKAIQQYGKEEDTTTGYALATNFIAAVAMAHMQGFNMLSELTYPFVTQTMVTNGQIFYFSAYQLNTLHMWRSDTGNNRQNLFLISKAHTLYDVKEDGTIESINEETLKKILKVLLLPTTSKRNGSFSPRLKYKKPPGKVSMYIPRWKRTVEVKKSDEIY